MPSESRLASVAEDWCEHSAACEGTTPDQDCVDQELEWLRLRDPECPRLYIDAVTCIRSLECDDSRMGECAHAVAPYNNTCDETIAEL